jgi:hypothetical protein
MAPQIFFKMRYVRPILSGRKTTTIRLRTRLHVGDVAQARCIMTEPPFSWLLVKRIEPITLGDLTARDARAIGLVDVDDMRVEWARLYPDTPWRDFRMVYRIHFEQTRAPRRTAR